MSRQLRQHLRFVKPLPITTKVDQQNPKLPPNVRVRQKALNFNAMYVRGPEGRLKILGNEITDLFKYERIELSLHKAEEVQGYAERLISEAIRNGDRHRATMELADFWIKEKQLIHKLFKVLVPRYLNYTSSFTSLHRLAPMYQNTVIPKEELKLRINNLPHLGVLELKGNPLPHMPNYAQRFAHNKNTLSNILLNEAAKEKLGKTGEEDGGGDDEDNDDQPQTSKNN